MSKKLHRRFGASSDTVRPAPLELVVFDIAREPEGEAVTRSRYRWVRRGIAYIAVIGSLLATTALSPSAAAEAASPPPDRPLRVATFNIHHGVGLDGLLDLERVARVIEQENVEVIGLQEVDRHWGDRSDFVDQARWLADRLGMDVAFGANLDRDPLTPGAPRRQFGTAILSHYKIRQWENTLLPRPEGGEQRGLLEATIKVRGVTVRVYNTHLQHNSNVERLAQISAIRQQLTGTSEPVVLLGDLNATPDSPEIAEITQDVVDAWLEAGEGDGFTFHAEAPYARIDYVMYSPDIVANTAAVVTTDASDHLPVAVDVALPGTRVGNRR